MLELIRQLNTTLGLNLPEWGIIWIRHSLVAMILFVVAPLQMLVFTYLERRLIARMQDRLGPNRVGPYGLFQPIADAVKMFTKEDIIPSATDKVVHLLAPAVVVIPVLLMVAVVPWGPDMVGVDLNTGLLFFFAISSVSAVGLLMAGWGSNNKFSLLGAMRAAAQMVSYEIPAVLSVLAIAIVTGTLSIVDIVNLQAGLFVSVNDIATIPDLGLGWFLFTPVGFLAFISFFIAALAEGERTPFDIPEADSEIVAGFMTEYSGMKFGLFYLANYVLNFLLCAITVTLFWGGWQGPGVGFLYDAEQYILAGILGVFYFLAKSYFFFFVMVWVRGAFPRLRIDQLMGFGWKFLIPLSLVNIVSASLWVAFTRWGAEQGMAFMEPLGDWGRWGVAFGVTLVINVAAYLIIVRINRSGGRSMEQLVEDQTFGAVTLP